MILTGNVADRYLHHRRRVRSRIQGWAAEAGLTVPSAITRASAPPEKTSTQELATSRADPDPYPEAGL
jgi:hypothetical protein